MNTFKKVLLTALVMAPGGVMAAVAPADPIPAIPDLDPGVCGQVAAVHAKVVEMRQKALDYNPLANDDVRSCFVEAGLPSDDADIHTWKAADLLTLVPLYDGLFANLGALSEQDQCRTLVDRFSYRMGAAFGAKNDADHASDGSMNPVVDGMARGSFNILPTMLAECMLVFNWGRDEMCNLFCAAFLPGITDAERAVVRTSGLVENQFFSVVRAGFQGLAYYKENHMLGEVTAPLVSHFLKWADEYVEGKHGGDTQVFVDGNKWNFGDFIDWGDSIAAMP